jgi:hypothetical protein
MIGQSTIFLLTMKDAKENFNPLFQAFHPCGKLEQGLLNNLLHLFLVS